MSPILIHTVKTVVYIGCTGVGAILGRAAAILLSFVVPAPSGEYFVTVCILSGLIVGFIGPFEQRVIWGRWLTASDADLAWIGRSSGTLLTGSIAAPCTIGFALGMLSFLMV